MNLNDKTITVIPNPIPDQFSFYFKSKKQEYIDISITDIQGRKVFQAKGNPNQKYLFGKSLRPGIYILQIRQGKDIRTMKLMKGTF